MNTSFDRLSVNEQIRWAGLLRVWKEYASGASAPALAFVLADCPDSLVPVVQLLPGTEAH